MNYIETVVLGVVSGVVTTFVLYWLSLAFSKIILPWYQRIIYKGVDVAGEWVGLVTGNESISWNVAMNIDQSAHFLRGTYTTVKIVKGKETKVTNMSFDGEVWEGFVSLKCRTISSKNLSFGSVLLKVQDGELVGQQIFRNLVSNGPNIVHLDLSLKRAEPNA